MFWWRSCKYWHEHNAQKPLLQTGVLFALVYEESLPMCKDNLKICSNTEILLCAK